MTENLKKPDTFDEEYLNSLKLKQKIAELHKQKNEIDKDMYRLNQQLEYIVTKEKIKDLEETYENCKKVIAELRLLIVEKDKTINGDLIKFTQIEEGLRQCAIGFHYWWTRPNGTVECNWCNACSLC